MPEEKVLTDAVSCFLVTPAQILLGKKTQKIGAGCRNGYGGGIENGESEKQAVMREVKEESGGVVIAEHSLEKVAVVFFHNTKSDGQIFVCKVHVYLAHHWLSEPQATEEMADPRWFDRAHLPLEEMMPADRYWLSEVLRGKKIIAKAYYGPFQQKLLRPTEIEIVDVVP